MLRRIIPCLDVKDGRVVKGTKFLNLRDAGDPVELARHYDEEAPTSWSFWISAPQLKAGKPWWSL